MDAAAKAFPDWADTSLSDRMNLLNRSLDALESDSERIVKLITKENGKTLNDSRAEVAAALGDARHHLTDARRVLKIRKRQLNDGVSTSLRREPVGVYVLITPWNFPLATILRKLTPALAFGNTVVVKPSELTSGVACEWFAILAKQGLPRGVANLVLGRGQTLGPALLEHDALRGVSFTGSTANGLALSRSVAGRDARLQVEMGGKNSLLVLADADLDAAVEAALVAGFSCAGQWCTGTGRVIVEAPIAEAFCAVLVEKASRLSVGPGHRKSSQIGSLISKDRVRFAERVLKQSTLEGARIACGGKRAKENGYFFEPTVLVGVSETAEAFVEELFLPILPVATAANFDEGLRLANKGLLGLSASIFTKNKRKAELFCCRVEAGIVHANLHTAFRVSDLPVAAWRDSGRGVPECGDFAKEFFTRPRAVYIKN
jgi:aldehyde dehydrogenase (NAD+)